MFVRKSLRQALYVFATSALILTACNMGATPAPTVDVNAINTAAVATAMGQLSAQFTQTALAAPTATQIPTSTAVSLGSPAATTSGALPSPSGGLPTVSFNSTPATGNTTPLAGFTPFSTVPPASGPTTSLGDSCNNSAYVADVTVPDNSVMKPGEDFQKVWAVKNTGTCAWDEGYAFVYIGGSKPDLDPYSVEFKKSSDFVAAGTTANIGVNLTAPCTPGEYQGTWRMRSDSGYYFGSPFTVIIQVKDKC